MMLSRAGAPNRFLFYVMGLRDSRSIDHEACLASLRCRREDLKDIEVHWTM